MIWPIFRISWFFLVISLSTSSSPLPPYHHHYHHHHHPCFHNHHRGWVMVSKNDLLNSLAMSDHFLKVFFFKKNPPTILFYWWGQGSETLMWGVANFSGFAHSSLVFFSEADNLLLLKEYKSPVCNICCLCCLPLKILTLKPFLLCRNARAYNIQAPVNLKHLRYYS